MSNPELSPEQAGRAQARLRGYNIDVQEVDGEWRVVVIGLLLLPPSPTSPVARGKRTSEFAARGHDAEKAVLCAMTACRRAYAPRAFDHIPLPPHQPHAPKAG